MAYAVARTYSTDGSWDLGETVGVLETLVVAPEHRSEGIGTLLLNTVRRQFAELGARRYEVVVVATNARARRFYERAGARSFLETLVAPT